MAENDKHINTVSAERLKAFRRKLGLSQQGLAGAIGVTQCAVGQWEKRGVSVSGARHIARAFDVEPAWLLGDVDDKQAAHDLDVAAIREIKEMESRTIVTAIISVFTRAQLMIARDAIAARLAAIGDK